MQVQACYRILQFLVPPSLQLLSHILIVRTYNCCYNSPLGYRLGYQLSFQRFPYDWRELTGYGVRRVPDELDVLCALAQLGDVRA